MGYGLRLDSELSAALSAEGAAILMEVVGSVTIAELATKTDIALLKSEMAELRGELKTEMAGLRTEMAELKQDITRSMAMMLFVSQGVLVSIVGLLVALG